MDVNGLVDGIVILRPAQVAQKKGIPRTTQHLLLKSGDFPQPIKISGKRAVGFIESEIDAWLRARMAARDLAVSTPANDAEKAGA